ncbi:pentatricopeptide repeat-containing protein [Salix suchowensis]|nr:pentatricopeptide repeat-containing protein [Salix suchowensis]
MDREAIKLTRILLKNTNDPKMSWYLFKRILSLPVTQQCPQSIPIITRILIRAKMLNELDDLPQLLIASQPQETLHNSLVSFIKVLVKSGLFGKAISQFKSLRFRFPENPPSIYLYNVLLRSCIKEGRVDCVSWLYKDMVASGVSPETYTFNVLIGFLCDSGCLDDARELFDKMHEKGCEPNEYSFGILVRGYCRAGFTSKGLELLGEMRRLKVLPNKVVYNTLISRFCKEGNIDDAEKLVDEMREDGLSPDVVTFNARISALCSSGKVLEASRIFRDMQIDDVLGLPQPNIITYNLMLGGFCKEGMLEEARVLFEKMKESENLMNTESYNIWLLGLVRNGKFLEAQLVLKEMVDMGMEPNVYSYNIVMDGLCKNGMLFDARMLLRLMTSSGVLPDTVTYSTLLHGYCHAGKVFEANNVLREMMRNDCSPNNYTCNILLYSLGYVIDTVTCNIVIDGLCNNGQLDKAIEIVSGMWTHGSAALGNLGNSYISLVDDSDSRKKCMPDLISYSTIISGLCKAGRVDEAKKKFIEMTGKNLHPDSAIYDAFIHSFCKEGKISSAFRVLKDMEKKGCNKTLQTYNSLIMGLGSKNQIFEIYGLMDEMRERGVSPDVSIYNNVLSSLCEGGRVKDAPSVLDEMLQKGIAPNISSFSILIKAFCKACDFSAVDEIFEIALNVSGHKEALYSLTFNELLVGGEVVKAKELFETALDRSFDVGNFLYKDLIDHLCKDDKLDDASGILHKLIDKGHRIDPASFMPVIDGLGKRGNKHEADELAEKMMEMASEGKVKNKVHRNVRSSIQGKKNKDGESEWQTILHRDDGSGIALKALKRVQRGLDQGSISSLEPQKDDFLDYWEGSH